MGNRKIVVLTGAGISAESGLETFRDAGGLWEGHDVMKVASPEGWRKDPKLVLDFYNIRRKQLLEVTPNQAHVALARLQKDFDVSIITQNIDDLHERAGSEDVLHLHGELLKACSTLNPELIYPWKKELKLGDLGEDGAQLRPYVVWFGEPVPMIEPALRQFQEADTVLIIGTSLQVYPAASLIQFTSDETLVIYVDPYPNISYELQQRKSIHTIRSAASTGVPEAIKLMKEYD